MNRFKLNGLISLIILCLAAGTALAAGPQDMGGWEIEGEYNQHYNVREMDEFKGEVKELMEVTPLEGMAPGVAMIVKDREDEDILVHIGPKWFVKDHPIRPGQKVKVRGAWAEIKGEEVFMGSKIKGKGARTYSYKVRLTSDGTPFWTMSPAQLAKERASD